MALREYFRAKGKVLDAQQDGDAKKEYPVRLEAGKRVQ